jgi:PHD/YefM family antitoxin component YafN of YafNO toxin-antitoxin module
MGTINRAISVLKEARTKAEVSGYIDMSDPQTISNPEDPAVVVVGLAKYTYQSLKKEVERQLKDLEKLAKRGNYKGLYSVIGKITKSDLESPLQAKIRTLVQVEEKMASGPYKRKITLAKRK